jgi:hypothetical protein
VCAAAAIVLFGSSSPGPAARGAAPALFAQALHDDCVDGPPQTAGGPQLRWATSASGEAPGLGSRFKVWAQCAPGAAFDAAAHADAAAAAAVVDNLWGPMTALMGPPVPDAGGPDEGGDPAIDFYLLAPGQSVLRDGETQEIVGVIAQAMPSPPYNEPRASGFVLLNRNDIRKAAFRGFVAHELFHVLQNAHNLDTTLRNGAYHWFVEASAMWAQMHFDPPSAARYVHPAFVDHFQPSQESLHSTAGDHAFASYVWPLFMAQETRNPAAVGDAWRAMAAARTWDDLNDAIDRQLSFATRFRDFALRNVNDDFDGRNLIGRRYTDADPTFPYGTRPWEFGATVKAPPSGTASESYPVELPSLTAVYHRYSVDGGGKVTIDFGGLQPSGDLHVDALVEIAGDGWEPRPRRLSGGGRLEFCRDKPEEDVQQVYLVLSNSQKREESRIQGSVEVRVDAKGCEEEEDEPVSDGDWRGTVRAVQLANVDENDLGICRERNPLSGALLPPYPCGSRTQTYVRKSFAWDVRGDTTKVIEAQSRQRYIIQNCTPQNDPERVESICKVHMDVDDTESLEDEAGGVAVREFANGEGGFEIVAGSYFAASPAPVTKGVLIGREVFSQAPGITLVITWSLRQGPGEPPPAEDPCRAAPEVCAPPPVVEPPPTVDPASGGEPPSDEDPPSDAEPPSEGEEPRSEDEEPAPEEEEP